MNYNPNTNSKMNPTMMTGNSSNPNNPNRRINVGGDLVLKPSCDGCGATSELYGSACKHRTLCMSCGRSMALSHQRCPICSAPIRHLIREYNVRANASTDKNFSIGRFVSGLPPFSKKKSAENKWSLHKDLQGRQFTEALKEKIKNKPWILEDETGQFQYQGPMEGSQSSTATYYLLMLQGKEFLAYPAGSWYNFTKVAQYKQLTLEEAEEKMNKRRHNATGYERWMMKAATNGAAAFGVAISDGTKKPEGGGEGAGKDQGDGSKGKKGKNGEGEVKGEEDEEEEMDRKGRLGFNKKGGLGGAGDDDEGDGGGKGDFDFDDDDIEKGDDWEHEEIFTDDDEAVGNDREEREDLLAPEIPAPPEIKQDDEEEEGEENGGLSKSGKELKKLLGKAAGLESEEEDDDEDDEDDEDLAGLAPKKKENIKEEPGTDKSPMKSGNEDSKSNKNGKGTPGSAKSNKGKRKPGSEDSKPASSAPAKKPKTEPMVVKEEISTPQPPVPPKASPAVKGSSGSSMAAKGAATPVASSSTGPVTEDEIRNVILSCTPITTQKLVAQFRPRLKNQEDKNGFAEKLKRISKIQKNAASGAAYIVLREN